jgi:membrane associated rhomboid family serine protease
MFLHGNHTHLLFNMFALWMFGRQLEYDLGPRRFLTYYMACGVGAALIQLVVGWGEPEGLTVGASGAIFGVLLAFGTLHPNAMIMLLIPPIPMKAKWFVIIYGLIELSLGVFSHGSSIAHFAHVGGMLWGWLLIRWWRRKGWLN